MTSDVSHDLARKQIHTINRFYRHIAIYVAVMILLTIIDIAGGGDWWCYWPALGWGIALVLQGINIYFDRWEQKSINEIHEREWS